MSDPRMVAALGDITRVEADAIVNAANTSLLGGGGVDGAIHRAGGPEILQDCMRVRARQGGCPTGEAVITTAGRLPAKWVVHAVGPVWRGGLRNEDTLLANAYRNSLALAVENGARTVAFPNISTGIYNFPKELAAGIVVRTVESFLAEHPEVERVTFVCFCREDLIIYQELLQP